MVQGFYLHWPGSGVLGHRYHFENVLYFTGARPGPKFDPIMCYYIYAFLKSFASQPLPLHFPRYLMIPISTPWAHVHTLWAQMLFWHLLKVYFRAVIPVLPRLLLQEHVYLMGWLRKPTELVTILLCHPTYFMVPDYLMAMLYEHALLVSAISGTWKIGL